ncbi:unnamed protein product [Miscanthus lutarioriparius]|uniref:TF-B3 domain-containing protein n=1 Tax=Miscanthus lutarioriparius TaxID=422564 RepID=A0A811R6X4_9POAL|nr:unnamed protein product [Miscanthus lutarioriparius]
MSTGACAPTRLRTTLTFAARVLPSPEPEAGRGATEPKGHRAQEPRSTTSHRATAVDLRAAGVRVPLFVACCIAAVRLMAEPDTDDMYTKTRLVPLHPWEPVADVGDALAEESRGGDGDGQQQRPRPLSFAKTLTQSDVNTGGGFSVPRLCALSIFPELDYSFDPPLQIISATDVHGVEWTFRHIYRGSPHRHLLTTGSSNFVHSKELLPGDSVVFDRAVVFIGLIAT